MIRIGLIADTHGYLDAQVFDYFKDVDEIWHAGDFGNLEIVQKLEEFCPLKGVYGNIDDQKIRQIFPYSQRFKLEGLDIWMVHIGGNPGRYALPIREEMESNPPDLFICGHSHILKIARDPVNKKMLYINPGAAGKQGFHVERTIVRFCIDSGKITNIEVVNLGSRVDEDLM